MPENLKKSNEARIAPSVLACNLARLSEECSAAIAAGADLIHFDVMDNHFVPNLSFGAPLLQSLRADGFTGFVDVHLMTENIEPLIEASVSAGANSITVHYESTPHVHRALSQIKTSGCQAGLAINISTPVAVVENLLDVFDMLLIMTINPGFGGQTLIPASLPKISVARKLFDAAGLSTKIQVDGGVKTHNIASIRAAGADTFVVGSDFFGASDYNAQLAKYRSELKL
ncbi:ribulose-phosphate 3-epimerase [Agrobacterium vitis]|uniref:ribulose-phosphate 3-epimerase n=1 Tax=Agrobacterium vitis TaxID=373 RepID=UPI0012E8145C|nr:ribulose-phosphate 3-epimerase [Agrobacterium vitis]MVA36889.1 ribulose-phosphate 3-epimerase [Agrobacterium vitis]